MAEGRLRVGVMAVILVAAVSLPGTLSAAHRRATRHAQREAVRADPAAVVDDPSLGVTWLADADLAAKDTFGVHGISHDGSMNYATAKKWVKAMNDADYAGHRNWTLPITPTPSVDSGCSGENKKGGGGFGIGCTKSPLASLYSVWFGLTSPETTVVIHDTSTGPFRDFQPYLYWTDVSHGKRCCFTFSFNTGLPGSNTNLHYMYVLPMIAGNPFDVSATDGSGNLYPADGGQAVYQPVAGTAGITWLADADLAQAKTFRVKATFGEDGSMAQTTAVEWVDAMDANGTHGWLGQIGWRLPTQKQLGGLYQALGLSGQEPVVHVPDTTRNGIEDVQPYLYWSCAGASIGGSCEGQPNPGFQWSFSLGNGFQGTDLVRNDLYVTAYYANPLPGKPPPPLCKPQKPGGASTCA